LKFRRQMPMSNYIVDFVCVDKQVIIELDGGQHTIQIDYDNERTTVLNQKVILLIFPSPAATRRPLPLER
jgi:very-short-patch-repair endonuclease